MTTDLAGATAVTLTGTGTTCPLCHADGPHLDAGQLQSGTWWNCQRCGQSWDNTRLAAVAAYAAFCANRLAPGAA